MHRKSRIWMFVPGVCFLLGFAFSQSGTRIVEAWKKEVHTQVLESATGMFLPEISYASKSKEKRPYLERQLGFLLPLLLYKEEANVSVATEDALTLDMLMQLQASDEERLSEDLSAESEESKQVDSSEIVAAVEMDKLQDMNYLLSKFYTIDSTTSVRKNQMNAEKFLAKDMHIQTETEGPKVLIFHTHSQEAFADSKKGDVRTTIVGMGAYLAEKLNEKGIETLHHAGVYDLIDGELDRSKAYEFSEIGVKEILNQYPSVEVVIDLHRDGVREDMHLVTEIDGEQVGRIMFFNGLSRTKSNGDIAYLYNPYIDDNLAFSFQMQLAAERMYPGLARRIYLKGYRYSLHMMPKSLLIEAGAQTNTVAEMRNTMDCLSNILYDVLVK